MRIGDVEIPKGRKRRVDVPVARLPIGNILSLPVIALRGASDGPVLWLSAAVHGDEVNGVEIIREVVGRLDPKQLSGTVIAVPIVNVFGFVAQSRYLPDRRDLNRSFPGSRKGPLASRLARLFVEEVIQRSDYGIDLHTGSHGRTNLPQIRADLLHPETMKLAKAFATGVLINAKQREKSLRQTAARLGIPCLVYEAGEPLRFSNAAVREGVNGVMRVIKSLDMFDCDVAQPQAPPVIARRTRWMRASAGGILRVGVALGDRVEPREVMATITDAYGTRTARVRAPFDGIVIGMQTNPLVYRGDAVMHVAEATIETGGFGAGK